MLKILKFTLIASAFLIFMAACEVEPEESYYSTLGVLKIKNDSILIESDQDNTLYILNKSVISAEFEDGDRIVASFTLMDMELPSGIDYIIDIYEIQEVLFKPIIEFEEELADSLGNDPIQIDGIWLAKSYMNLNFSYLGGQLSHYINLVYYPDSAQNDTVVIEILHNDNDDSGNIAYSSFVSFDLSPIQPADSVVLRVLSDGYNNEDFDECVTYHNPN